MDNYFNSTGVNASMLNSLLNNSYSYGNTGIASSLNSAGSSSVNASNAQNALNTLIFENVLQTMLNSMSTSSSSDSSGYGGYSSLLSSLVSNQGYNNYSNLLYSNSNYDLNRLLYSTLNANSTSPSSSVTSDELGALSAKYESNGNPGTIANNSGDSGGKSYGAWQFSANKGSLNSFISWLKNNNEPYYNFLTSAKANDGNTFGSNFDSAWRYLADKDRAGFLDLQRRYVKNTYYDAAVDKIKDQYGIDINSRSKALQSVVWSTAVQFGVGGVSKIFSRINTSGSDADLINGIYNEKEKVNEYFRSSSSSIRNSVYNRALNEKADALAMLYSDNTERG
ncbi:hypothetical protein [Clostridium oryzae]|uniref:Type VI secretion system spike protein VgrG3-like C-terminal domain-containing protein n=1 Tax=Clostridium oryzae TaxID=1450648 RepID=A0A1V4IRI2_9CLOT|nr:hypothetical protein [Clostridium oryzae]OPJ62414.1 hypothetical protein CLORY_17830 [Clostridium oryzae]